MDTNSLLLPPLDPGPEKVNSSRTSTAILLTKAEETDSYMYQTVGQDAVDYVAKALEVPLYRRVISGTAKEQRSEYGDRTTTSLGVAGDETEDLYELLSEVKVRFFETPLNPINAF